MAAVVMETVCQDTHTQVPDPLGEEWYRQVMQEGWQVPLGRGSGWCSLLAFSTGIRKPEVFSLTL